MSYSFSSVEKLSGRHITLRPIQKAEVEPAARALISETTWFSTNRNLNSLDAFQKYFVPVLERQQAGVGLTLLARLKSNDEIVGMSTFQYPSANFKKIEIGFTWVAEKWHRTFVNTEMKYLMLNHAFNEMRCSRVEFLVAPRNEKSNAAVKRIGATFEGTLRKWRFLQGFDDGNRNMYSILDDEWPRVQEHLNKLMGLENVL